MKKEIYGISKTAQDMKHEFNKDMENIRKKESNRNSGNKKFDKSKKKKKESHSSRLEQVQDRLSGLEDKTEIRGKTEELLDKRLKNYK
jgi:hypothetical protein